jgi:cytochrome c oxidase cbb3-type subunit I
MGGSVTAVHEFEDLRGHSSPGVSTAVYHALLWLVVSNAIGVVIAILLLVPSLNPWLGEWTYGRWMMVHMNLALYGWCALPMIGFLFRIYGADRGDIAQWCRPIIWLWSSALLVGSFSWLAGHSSGKLFLDWSGSARVYFPLTMLVLWLFLAVAFFRNSESRRRSGQATMVVKIAGLASLLAVPFAIYFASNPAIYPHLNPDSGGPTGVSQLESSLGIVIILLFVPLGLTDRKQNSRRIVVIAWLLFLVEALLCAALGRWDATYDNPAQYLSLASLLAWIPLIPAYYAAFQWKTGTHKWQRAFLCWWAGLVISGWIFFLPRVLARFKFTDGLVGHSLTAVAGFLTAFLLFVMVQLLEERHAWILNRRWSFYAWNLGVLAYVVDMTIAGWIEGGDPEFTIVPGNLRNILYVVRLLTGLAMLAGSVDWLVAAGSLASPHLRIKTDLQRKRAA